VARKRGVLKHTYTNPGFTLVEILVALAVMSAATFIIVALYTNAMSLAEINRCRKVAASLAEERMADLVRNPGQYRWPDLQSAADGELIRVVPGKPARMKPDPPKAMPLDSRMYKREANFYDGFLCEAYVKAPANAPEAGYVEVTVAVRWTREGRDYVFTLTSAMPRAILEETA